MLITPEGRRLEVIVRDDVPFVVTWCGGPPARTGRIASCTPALAMPNSAAAGEHDQDAFLSEVSAIDVAPEEGVVADSARGWRRVRGGGRVPPDDDIDNEDDVECDDPTTCTIQPSPRMMLATVVRIGVLTMLTTLPQLALNKYLHRHNSSLWFDALCEQQLFEVGVPVLATSPDDARDRAGTQDAEDLLQRFQHALFLAQVCAVGAR